jgi:hypothetical protein
VANGAKSFASVKAALAAIDFFYKVNLFEHELAQCPAVCLVRNAARAMCRYDDAPGFKWRNIRFVENGSGF